MTDPEVTRAHDVLADAHDHARFGASTIRKGTVAAFVANARAWSALPADDERAASLAAELVAAAPALEAIGVLEVFAPRDRRFAALLDRARD